MDTQLGSHSQIESSARWFEFKRSKSEMVTRVHSNNGTVNGIKNNNENYLI